MNLIAKFLFRIRSIAVVQFRYGRGWFQLDTVLERRSKGDNLIVMDDSVRAYSDDNNNSEKFVGDIRTG